VLFGVEGVGVGGGDGAEICEDGGGAGWVDVCFSLEYCLGVVVVVVGDSVGLNPQKSHCKCAAARV
jgi:hypothetical protein